MSLIIENLTVSYEIPEGTSEDDINSFLEGVVIPEINSINEEKPSYFKTVPNQAPYPDDHKDAYFSCEQAFDEFYGNPARLEDILRYELSGCTIYWKAETDNSVCDLTRYLAWRTFTHFGKESTFVSLAIYEDMWETWHARGVVGLDALIEEEE
jgi:hypothetical protein